MLTITPLDSTVALGSPVFEFTDLEPVEALLARWQSVEAAAFEAEYPAASSTPLNVELPPTKSAPRRRIIWTPSAPGRASAGRLTIITGREISYYLLRESAADGGIHFHFAKLSPGSDPSEKSHDVFLADPATADAGLAFDSCTCKGHLRHLHCKHVDAARVIVGQQAPRAVKAPSSKKAAKPAAVKPSKNAAPGYKHLTKRDLANDAAFRL